MLFSKPRYLKMVVMMTTYHTLKSERLLKNSDIKYKTIMKPRYVSSDCGLAITFEADRYQEASEIITKSMAQELVGFFDYCDGEWVDKS